MRILIIILFLISAPSFAKLRVMTFNTTCSVCNKGHFDKFKHRKHWIVDTIKRANPDLISMQEVLLPHQLHWFKKQLKEYKLTYHRRFYIFRYADPALFVRANRFDILSWGGYWQGPNGGGFSLGWKKGLPRRLMFNRLWDKKEQREFYLIGTHFDNSTENKENSARMLTQRFGTLGLPMIFAADTNLKPEMEGFKHLQDYFFDSFELAEKITFVKNSDTNKDDSCNLEKGKTFPDCRVDHIMLSKNFSWSVSEWFVDQYKYGEDQKFTSDHRAYFADIELQ